MQDFLQERVAELESRARETDINFEEMTAALPEDPRARVAALATVLRLDALQAIREGITLEQLEQARTARQQAAEQVERESAEAGIPWPGTGGEG